VQPAYYSPQDLPQSGGYGHVQQQQHQQPVNVTVVLQPGSLQAPQQQQQQTPMQIPNCPPGLEYLGILGQVLIKQKWGALETVTSFEAENKVSKYK